MVNVTMIDDGILLYIDIQVIASMFLFNIPISIHFQYTALICYDIFVSNNFGFVTPKITANIPSFNAIFSTSSIESDTLTLTIAVLFYIVIFYLL